jgi:hypothetical protein
VGLHDSRADFIRQKCTHGHRNHHNGNRIRIYNTRYVCVNVRGKIKTGAILVCLKRDVSDTENVDLSRFMEVTNNNGVWIG